MWTFNLQKSLLGCDCVTVKSKVFCFVFEYANDLIGLAASEKQIHRMVLAENVTGSE